jgi:myotubularin-related protein 6/7/8
VLHVVPASVSDVHLQLASRFRTKGRFPSLTYFDKETGCSIWRSSQIMTGIMAARNQDDERLLSEIASLSPNQSDSVKLVIYDARSYINALANKVMSGGYENTRDYYRDCDIVFCDIDNIHAVRDAMNKVYDLG